MAGVKPNHAHHALAALERVYSRKGGAAFNCTQNVDRLLQRAGCESVLELHGTIHTVECLECKQQTTREEVQTQMMRRNLLWHDHWSPRAVIKPDGDSELPETAYASFAVPSCLCCGGKKMKPLVVFHGANIPKPVVDASLKGVDDADGLLLVGSTATVFSCFRLIKKAKERGIGVGVINVGPTRADEIADFKIEREVGSVLSALAAELGAEALPLSEGERKQEQQEQRA
jgi:NAD-dependent SIR2 family protein deacetylase